MSAPARVRSSAGLVLAGLLLAGCAEAERQQSMLEPVGTSARAVDGHWLTMLWIGSAVWVVVVVMLIATLVRRRPDQERDGRRAPVFVAVAGAVIPAAIIIGVMAQSVLVMRDTDPGRPGGGETVIALTGHQFWWEVEYPGRGVVTANEIHIPTGERVQVEVTSQDVVHSVWVPQLSGKMDMIPGRTNTMWLETEEPGTYWGQCAEYCGMQHALMRFVVVAHEPEEFEGWVSAQAQPAAGEPRPLPEDAPGAPSDDGAPDEGFVPGQPEVDEEDVVDGTLVDDPELVAQGREVFMSSSCVYCHTVAGTEALGELGPDLTHLASRDTLAAGILPNNRGNLAAWIVDPQSIKPGNLMPGTDLAGDELQALLAYLESLE